MQKLQTRFKLFLPTISLRFKTSDFEVKTARFYSCFRYSPESTTLSSAHVMAHVRIPERLCYVWIKNGAFGFGIKLYPKPTKLRCFYQGVYGIQGREGISKERGRKIVTAGHRGVYGIEYTLLSRLCSHFESILGGESNIQ